jgi:hypothetical protein
MTITTPSSRRLHTVSARASISCAQACTLLRNQSTRLSTLSTPPLCLKRVATSMQQAATRQLTDGQGRGVHSSGGIGGGRVEAIRANSRAAPDLRTSWMRRAGAQANGKVLQHQMLLHRPRAARAFAHAGAQGIRTADTDAAPVAFRFPVAGVRSRGAADATLSSARGCPCRDVTPHRLNRAPSRTRSRRPTA